MKEKNEYSAESTDEKRFYERLDAGGMKVLFKGKQHLEAQGRVHDISRSGMFLETNATERVGDYINADIDAEDLGLIIWTQGRVVRVSNEGMGVQFTGLDEKGLDVYMHLHRS